VPHDTHDDLKSVIEAAWEDRDAITHATTGARPVLRQPLTTQQIIGAVGELVPGEMKDSFPAPSVEFRYQAPSGEVQVRFESKGETATGRVAVRAVAMRSASRSSG